MLLCSNYLFCFVGSLTKAAVKTPQRKDDDDDNRDDDEDEDDDEHEDDDPDEDNDEDDEVAADKESCGKFHQILLLIFCHICINFLTLSCDVMFRFSCML